MSSSPPEEVAPARRAAPADAAAQLVQLGDAEAVGALDHHHRRLGHVDADLDDRRRDEDLELAGAEAAPSPPRGRPAPSARAGARPGGPASSSADEALELLGGGLGLDPGRLARRAGTRRRPGDPAATSLAHPVPGPLLAAGPSPGSHSVVTGTRPGGSSSRVVRSRSPKITMAAVRGIGVAVMTRRSGSPSVPLARERGPLLDAEAVLLVDHDAAEGAERDLLGQQGMGADDEADLARGEALEDRGARLALDLAGEELDADHAARHAAGALEVAEQRARRR